MPMTFCGNAVLLGLAVAPAWSFEFIILFLNRVTQSNGHQQASQALE